MSKQEKEIFDEDGIRRTYIPLSKAPEYCEIDEDKLSGFAYDYELEEYQIKALLTNQHNLIKVKEEK